MEQLKKSIAEFHAGFEDLLVSLHKVFLDIKSKIKSEKLINQTLESGKNRLAELDRLIDQCMQNLSENEDLQGDLMQFLVSYRPRLENEINLIEDSIKNPADYEEAVQQDDDLSQMLSEAEAEILRTIQDEKDKMEQLKIQQTKKQAEDEVIENQRLFEQQEQMRQTLKNYENQQKEQKKNSWLQEGEFQSFIETKRKNQSRENNFNVDTTDNWSFQDDDDDENENASTNDANDANDTNDKDEEGEEETTNERYENEQELANKLLFQFLGMPNENQYIESNENADEKKESENAEEKNQIENKETKNEENQTESNINKENEEIKSEENKTEISTNKENEEIKNEENQEERNENANTVVSTE